MNITKERVEELRAMVIQGEDSPDGSMLYLSKQAKADFLAILKDYKEQQETKAELRPGEE